MKLGSLFDGSGGFPLAGALCGIEPVWASEIEPYPIRVTTQRFPRMKHLGDITKIDGGKIEPVDVITFGSPCQDLSVAGKRAGIHDGARSSLFFHAVRIMKEMREATNGVYPRIVIWENVHGAFSSNKGMDFLAVLYSLCEIADSDAYVPYPRKGKWGKAGCIMGDGYSIAWRTYDAQYWGVPQRRRRIYLVADLGGERAGEILFEQEGVRGDSAQGIPAREAASIHAAGGAGRSDGAGGVKCLNPWDSQTIRQYSTDGVYPALSANEGGGGRRDGVCVPVGVFMGGQGADAGGIAYSEKAAPTLRAVNSGSNQVPDIVYPGTARTLTAEHDSSPCADRGQNIVVRAAGFNDSVGERAKGGMEYTEERSPTLRSGDVRAVVYDARGNGGEGVAPTLTGDHENRVTDYTALCVGNEQVNQISMAEQSNTLDCMHDQQIILSEQKKQKRRYIIRRLTPLECCRLQGFPDWWTEGCERHPISMEHATNKTLFLHVNPMGAIEGKDGPKYRLWGNGVALPCVLHVMQGVARVLEDTR